MTFVSKDELHDTIQENFGDFNRALDKAELRMETRVDHLERLVRSGKASPSIQDFNKALEDIDELRDLLVKMGRQVRLLQQAVEELALGDG